MMLFEGDALLINARNCSLPHYAAWILPRYLVLTQVGRRLLLSWRVEK